jgi:hypothetical protein
LPIPDAKEALGEDQLGVLRSETADLLPCDAKPLRSLAFHASNCQSTAENIVGQTSRRLISTPDTGDPNVYRVVALHEVVMSLPALSSSGLFLLHVRFGTLSQFAPSSERMNTVNTSFYSLCCESKKDEKWDGVGHRSRTPRRKRRSLGRRLEQQQAIEAVSR